MAGRPRSFEPEEALDRAMSVFWKKGYERTGLLDLEESTGLGRQSLYNVFGDKRALFTQVVEHYFANVLKPGVIDVLDAPGSARRNIERIFASWEAAATAPEFNGCLVGNAASEVDPTDAPMVDLLRQKLELMETAFRRALLRAQTAGEVSPDLDVRATARSLLVIAQGLAVVARVRRERAFVRGVVESARSLLG